MNITQLSDHEIVARLRAVCREQQRLLAHLIVLLVEVEARRLHLRTACPSVFEFCRQELGMSEAAAFRRCVAARLVTRHPRLLGAIERGEIHLSTVCLLRDHVTEENLDELLAACRGKSTRHVQELVARLAPRPDVPNSLRKLRTRSSPPTTAAGAPTASRAPAAQPSAQGSRLASPTESANTSSPVASPSPSTPRPAPPSHRARVEPLSAERYKLQVTISGELRDKIHHVRNLMQHSNPTGDLERVLERAIDALIEKLEKQRLAKTDRPQAQPREAEMPRVTAAVRRAVFERDGLRCTYFDARGKRCTSCTLLELDHVLSRADGGSDDPENLRVRCRAHNLLWAEQRFGREHIEHQIDLRRARAAAHAAPS
ncbi:MAG TPA: HNH endonuclease [Labilithrix sp.]|jgi:hypothetical protein